MTRIPGLIDIYDTAYAHVGRLAHLAHGTLTFDPAVEPEYGLAGALDDHGSTGFDESGARVSGYYSSLAALLGAGGEVGALDVCEGR